VEKENPLMIKFKEALRLKVKTAKEGSLHLQRRTSSKSPSSRVKGRSRRSTKALSPHLHFKTEKEATEEKQLLVCDLESE